MAGIVNHVETGQVVLGKLDFINLYLHRFSYLSNEIMIRIQKSEKTF